MLSLSADVGGTFTDVVLVDSRSRTGLVEKVLTTPGSTEAIREGMKRLCARAGVGVGEIDVLIHGFTIATNAWLTRQGARVVLLTTAGFRDVLEIATQRRSNPYDLALKPLRPLAERSYVLEVPERIDAFGGIVEPLTASDADAIAEKVARLKPEAVAISLLFGFLNNQHEKLLMDAMRRRLPDTPVYASHTINPQLDEYPRTNTTVTAAYVGPVVSRYISRIEADMPAAGMTAPILLMRSDGGVSTIEATRTNPATMLLSGPAGGVIAALELSRLINQPNLITFDMGGTSADFSLIADGRTRMINTREVQGEILRLPSLDIQTISSGGGSVGSIDAGGALRVGPESAGSTPGPACYGRGGTKATLTDAALVMGLLDPNEYAGGTVSLDIEAARAAVSREIAHPLGLSVEEAAYAMVAVANAQMAQAIQRLAVERGCDLRQFGLVSFGGAGSIFAPFLAVELNMLEIVVPLRPGVFSATGLMLTDMRYAYQRPFLHSLASLSGPEVGAAFHALIEQARSVFLRDRIDEQRQSFVCHADMRYVGQVHELTIELPQTVLHGLCDHDEISRRFLQAHEQAYGFADPGMEIELVNLRLEAIGLMPKVAIRDEIPARVDQGRAIGSRTLYLGPRCGFVEARVLARHDLAAGETLTGPLIINQPDTTIFVLPEQNVHVDGSGVLRIHQTQREG
ncbi:MAG TPA: hydantoinase/oxoprolinase family protein [Bradyrhizobium sp.]|nr:hydantoinase/oxoprolinase family protein [Bradyrhizobium sp.]